MTAFLAALASAAPAHAAPGDLDEAFSGDGFADLESGVRPNAIAAGPLGTTLVAGSASDGSSLDEIWIARYTASGEPDSSFGQSGSVRYDVSALIWSPQTDSLANAVAVGPDGSIVLGGETRQGFEEERGVVMRLRPDGSLDPDFDGDGIITLDRDVSDVELDGSRVLAASGEAVWAWLADGTPDPSFDGDGHADAVPASQLELGGGGSIVLGAHGEKSVTFGRLDANGQPDRGFAGDGSTETEIHDIPLVDAGLQSMAVGGDGEIALGAQICFPTTTGPSGGFGYCVPTVQGATPSGEVLGHIVEDVPGWAVATDPSGEAFLVGGDRSPGRYGGPIALSRNRFDGSYDPSFGREGTAIAYYGLEGGKIIELAVETQRVSALLYTYPAGEAKLARFELDGEPPDADADRHLDTEDRCDLYFSRSPSGCPAVPRTVHLRRNDRGELYAFLSSAVERCEQNERLAVYRRQRGRDELVQRGRTTRSSVMDVARNPARGAYYAVAKRHLKTEAGRCAGDRSRVKVVDRA